MIFHDGLFLSLIHWAVSALALMLTAWIVPGFELKNYGSALTAALVLGVANAFLRPLFLLLTLPLTILTLGLFTFVVDAAILKICAAILRGFTIKGWLSATLGAILLAVLNSLLHFAIA